MERARGGWLAPEGLTEKDVRLHGCTVSGVNLSGEDSPCSRSPWGSWSSYIRIVSPPCRPDSFRNGEGVPAIEKHFEGQVRGCRPRIGKLGYGIALFCDSLYDGKPLGVLFVLESDLFQQLPDHGNVVHHKISVARASRSEESCYSEVGLVLHLCLPK
jgi:hypothetical protein